MEKLIRAYTTDSGEILWFKVNESYIKEDEGDLICVETTKKNLVAAIWQRTKYHEILTFSELGKKSKSELLEIAENNELIINKGEENESSKQVPSHRGGSKPETAKEQGRRK